MRKIGLFGGSFNPIHQGHLLLAEQAREALKLDKVIFIPARMPPHKNPRGLAKGEDRLRMVRLAIAGNPHFEASSVEMRRRGVSYTVDTVNKLRRRFGKTAELYFLIGMDTVKELSTWKDIRELTELCRFVPLSRPGVKRAKIGDLVPPLSRVRAQEILRAAVPMPLVDISSSDIRNRIAEGRSIRYMMSDAVAAYILRKKLYTR